MAADFLPAEVDVVGFLQDDVELADFLWHLSATEQLQHATHSSFCHFAPEKHPDCTTSQAEQKCTQKFDRKLLP